MKQILLLIFIAVITSIPAQAGLLSGIDYDDAVAIKNGKVIIGIYEHEKRETAEEAKKLDEINNNIVSIIKEYWTYSTISEVLPLKEAVKKANKDKNLYVLFIGDYENFSNSRYYNPNLKDPSLLMSKGKAYAFLRFGLPYTETGMSKASVMYSVRSMQRTLEQIYNKEAENYWEQFKAINSRSSELEGKTLYIPQEYLHEKVNEEVIKAYYPYNFKVVSTTEWKNVILSAKADDAFLVYNLLDTGKAYAHMLYLVEAQGGSYVGQFRMDSAVKIVVARKKPFKMNKKAFEKLKDALGF